ncbi:class I SAM-dependent methyltransferase [Comamonas sp. NoAH]|uniref:class I SAM-dependent methyltransferase n=1 Tax=Comamonas halotolerans TaxID=3041496 RepID=UPI0032E9E4C1
MSVALVQYGDMRVLNYWMWPIPALLVWGAAWACFLMGQIWLPGWGALALASLLSLIASLWGQTWWRRAMLALGFPLSWMVLAAGTFSAWWWLLPLCVLLLLYPLNAWRDAPVFPTPAGALDGLSDHIHLPEGACVLDAGCGAGDGLKALHGAWPHAKVYGVEWSWPLRWLSAVRCPWATVRRSDLWQSDWDSFDLVYLFQRPESMSRAAVKSLGEMRPGTWLVSLSFPVPDASPTYVVQLEDGREVYAYQAPLAAVDHDSVHADEVAGMLPLRPQGIVVHGQSLYPAKPRPGGRRTGR